MTAAPTPSSSALRLLLEATSPAPIHEVWALVSDTDRLNAVAGFGFQFEEVPAEGGAADLPARRIGRGKWLGVLSQTWEELPFRYRAPEHLTVQRRFDGGPAREMTFTLDLTDTGQGTRIRCDVVLEPRNVLMRPLVQAELQMSVKPRLERALASLAQAAGDEDAVARLLPPPPLDEEASRHLDEALARVGDAAVAGPLRRYLHEAPLRDQDRMNALRLGRRWGLSDNQAITGFVKAALAGALSLSWDVVCPACRAPRMRLTSLAEVAGAMHCDACAISFDASFPDSLYISFRPAPAVRQFEVDADCVGSPARRPHLVSQADVFQGRTTEVPVFLPPGTYRVRTWPVFPTTTLEVTADGIDSRVDLVATQDGLRPSRATLKAGPVMITARGEVRNELDLVVERRWLPPDMLTGSRLMEAPEALALLPRAIIELDTEVHMATAAVLMLETAGGAPIDQRLRLFGSVTPRFLRKRFDGALALFDTLDEALAALDAARRTGELIAALSTGPVGWARSGADRVPLGAPLDEALALLRQTPAGHLSLPPRLTQDPATTHTIAPWHPQPGRGTLPAAWVKLA